MPRPKKIKNYRKFAKRLIRGLRREGMSIVEVCQEWEITPKTYFEWIKKYPEFAEAHEIGERDKMAYWEQMCRKAAVGEIKANGTIMKVAASMMLGWTEKLSVESNAPQQIQTIKIQLIDAQRKPADIEYEEAEYIECDKRDNNLSDEEPDSVSESDPTILSV